MDNVPFQHEATRTQANDIVMWFAIIPAVAFVVLAAVLPLVDAGPSHDSPTLLFLLNAMFLALFPLLASGLAARTFIASGSTSVLLLGCGLLTMSWASLLAGWVSSLPDGANDTVTVHNLCFMLSGVFLLAGSLVGTSTRGKHRILPERPEARLLAAYGMVIVLVTAVTAGAVEDLFPVFFVQGEGPTLLRQLVLAAAITLFSLSSFIYAHLFFRTKASFLWWYFLALLLIAQGLAIVLFQKAMGTPINWAGRGFQYLGGVYLFVAVWECLKEARSKRTSFEKVLTALVDVGDLNKAEESLRESKARFSTFFHASPMSVAITRLADNQLVDVNESWQNLTGFTREEVLGRTPLELNIWVDFGERDRLIRNLREQGIVRGFEIQIRQKSGNIRHLIMAAEMIELAGESILLSMAVDITDRKQVEEELRRSEERLRLTLEATNDGIWDWDIPTGNAIFSQRWYTMLGYEPYEFPQSYDSWRGLVHPDDVDRGEREIRKHISSGEGYSVELRMKTKSGGWQWIQTRGRVVEWAADGHAVRLVGTHSDITERKLAEETIREAENKYRSIFENSREGIYQSTPEGRYLTVNPAMARIYGYSSPEEMVSSITSIDREIFVIPENRDELKQLVPTKGAVRDFQVQQRRKDGSIFWASLNVHAVYGDDGSIRYWEGRSIDITARVQQDREIKLLNRLYSVLSQVSQAVVRATNPEAFLKETCRVIAVEGGFLLSRVGRVDPETGAVVPVASFGEAGEYARGITVYADDRPEGRGPTGTSIRERRPVVYNDFLHDPLAQPWSQRAGSFGINAVAAFPIESEGRVWGALTIYSNEIGFFGDKDVKLLEKVAIHIGFALDNLERERRRREAEDALLQSEERYRTLFEDAVLGIFRSTPEGKIIEVNPAYARMYGFESPEDVKVHINDVAVDLYADPSHRQAIVNRILASEGPIEAENQYLRNDGSVFTGNLHAWAVRDADGKFLCLEGFVEDITERKRAEEERRALEERLQRAEKMESLGTMAGGVAHDLNNVLGIVVGYSELLLDDLDESGSARSKAMEILKGGQRAAAIVQDLLTLARRGIPSRLVLNLNSILMDCQKSPEFAGIFSFHSTVRIKNDFEADLLNISGSPIHLGKSFLNLVSNAAEAMIHGGTLTIRTRNQYLDRPVSGYDEVKEGDYVVLSLTDAGEGIPAANLKRIFEPFYTKKVMGRSGSGLGLAVVWGTVKDHHGYINVESEEGKGTTFTLYFPVTREELSSEELAVSASEYMGNGESILIVDDIKEQRDLAAMMLTRLNYKVSSVSSGEEAVKYMQQHTVDLVLLDMIMDPGMDGLGTFVRILEIHPHQKAIIVSGFSETERVIKAQELGAGPYVKKPYVLEKLGLAVRKEIDRLA